MTHGPAKLESLQDGHWKPHRHASLYQREQTTGPARLHMSVDGGAVALLERLVGTMDPPFGVLYVLVTPRSDDPPGRYQNERPWDRGELAAFLDRFGAALEGDARHSLWIMSLATQGSQVIYDNHDLLYAYGDLDAFERVAREHGLEPGAPSIPVPHRHCYNHEFDADAEAILADYAWVRYPLVEGVDDP